MESYNSYRMGKCRRINFKEREDNIMNNNNFEICHPNNREKLKLMESNNLLHELDMLILTGGHQMPLTPLERGLLADMILKRRGKT